MKKHVNLIILILALFLSSCSEEILDKSPLDRYSDATVWSDPALAKAYMNDLYDRIGHGFHGVMLGAVSDELMNGRGPSATVYHKGIISADKVNDTYGNPWYSNCSWNNFENVQRMNVFLDNIDNVVENFPEVEKEAVKAKTDIMKGEVTFLRAWTYHQMCRSYGGLPIMNKANILGDDFSTLVRSTWEETVNFIVKDCDDAAALLKLKSETEMGHATKEAALALKSRILLFAASDLTADGNALSDLVGYASPNRTALWTAAKDAAKAVIDLQTCELEDLGAPDQKEVAVNYHAMFKAYDLSSSEVIFGKMFKQNVGPTHSFNRTSGPNGNSNFGRNGPLQRMVDSYEMSDGSKFFDHFSIVNDEYKANYSKFSHENPYLDREPRFYGSVLYDSCVWQKRFEQFVARDPLGIYDRRTRLTYQGGVEISKLFGIDTRNGPQDSWNGTYGGYLTKKWMDDQSNGRDFHNQNSWIYMRYAEVILNYAEACIETDDIPTATTYINMIRNRAGLPDFTGDITEALRYERKIELFNEDNRWYDIRRWKILLDPDIMPTINYGIEITQIEDLDAGTITTTWKQIKVQDDNNIVEKCYWIPIETNELKKAPWLVQNPGY